MAFQTTGLCNACASQKAGREDAKQMPSFQPSCACLCSPDKLRPAYCRYRRTWSCVHHCIHAPGSCSSLGHFFTSAKGQAHTRPGEKWTSTEPPNSILALLKEGRPPSFPSTCHATAHLYVTILQLFVGETSNRQPAPNSACTSSVNLEIGLQNSGMQEVTRAFLFLPPREPVST